MDWIKIESYKRKRDEIKKEICKLSTQSKIPTLLKDISTH